MKALGFHPCSAWLILAFVLVYPLSDLQAVPEARHCVAVLMYESREEYDIALKALRERLPAVTELYNLDKDPKRIPAMIQAIRESRPDLVIAFGADAYEISKKHIEGIPVMFSMVAYPEQYITKGAIPFGVSLQTDPRVEMALVGELVGTKKRVGMIYDPALSEKLIEHMRVSAAAAGLSLEAVPARSEKEAYGAIDTLKDRADIFFLIPDSMMASGMIFERLRLECARRSTPIIGFSKKFLDKGCLAVLAVDYEYIGRLTGEKAAEFLEKGTGLAIHQPRETLICVNVQVAKKMGFTVPESMKSKALFFE